MDAPRVEWRTFLTTLIVTLACVATFWILIPPTYLTNDDAAIRRDIEGWSAPDARPTGFVLMAHSSLTWALVGIQRLLPIDAWDVTLGALLVWSAAVFLTLAWTWGGAEKVTRSTAVLVVLVALVPLLIGMQFTISSALAGGAALALAATEIFSTRIRVAVLAMTAAMLLLGILVRPVGAAAGAIFTGALLMPVALSDPASRKARGLRLAVLVTIVAVSTTLLVFLDEALYRGEDAWNAYHQSNWMLPRLFEWGGDLSAAAIDQMRARAGWSVNDWATLKGGWGVDMDVHGFDRISTAYASWGELVDWRMRAQWLATRTATNLDVGTVARLLRDSAVPLAAGLLFAAARARRRGLVLVVAMLAIFYSACVALEIGLKELPFRLFAPLQACLVVAIVITSGVLGRQASRPATVVTALFALTLLAYESRVTVAAAVADVQQSAAVDQQVADLVQLKPSLLVLHSDSFPSEHWWRPFHTPPVRLPAIQVGLTNENPYLQGFLNSTGRQPLLRTMCEDPSVFIVAELDRLQPVTTFVLEHFGLNVVWTEVYAGSFRAWRCTVAPVR